MRSRIFSLLALLPLLASCGNPNALPVAVFENVVDTTTLYAITGTAIGLPSGFDGVIGQPARTELSTGFDFAVDLDSTGGLVLYPAGALGVANNAGILPSTSTFDELSDAPLEGYVADSAVSATIGTVFVLKSRPSSQQCAAGTLSRYGKLRVLAVDATARSVTFEVLADLNCGYRGLEPGIPES